MPDGEGGMSALNPDPGAVADAEDQAGWDEDELGTMEPYAAPDDAVVTVPWPPPVHTEER